MKSSAVSCKWTTWQPSIRSPSSLSDCGRLKRSENTSEWLARIVWCTLNRVSCTWSTMDPSWSQNSACGIGVVVKSCPEDGVSAILSGEHPTTYQQMRMWLCNTSSLFASSLRKYYRQIFQTHTAVKLSSRVVRQGGIKDCSLHAGRVAQQYDTIITLFFPCLENPSSSFATSVAESKTTSLSLSSHILPGNPLLS